MRLPGAIAIRTIRWRPTDALAPPAGSNMRPRRWRSTAGSAALTEQRPKAGYLISLRGLTLHRAYLDDLQDELLIEVERLAGEGVPGLLPLQPEFGLGEPVLEGRAAVLLEAAA